MSRYKVQTRTRRWLILILLIYTLVFAWVMSFTPAQRVLWLRAFGVAAYKPDWIDLRVIAAAIHEKDSGGNPYLSNPTDPLERRFNYPRIWLELRFLATNSGLYVWMLFQAGAAAVVLAWFTGKLTFSQTGFLALLLFSPAVSLLVERANSDLFIFALLGMGVLAIYSLKNTWLGAGLITVASVAKLYPAIVLAAVPVLVPRRAWFAWATVGILFGAYLLLDRNSVTHALKATPVGWLSYGTMTIAVLIARGYDFEESALRYFMGAVSCVCLALLLMGIYVGSKKPAGSDRFRNIAGGTGFVIGATIYLATFFAGCSFDYRLVFLLFGCRYIFRYEYRDPGDRFWVIAWYIVCTMLFYSPVVWGRIFMFVHAGAAAAIVPILGYFLGRIFKDHIRPAFPKLGYR